MDSMESKRGQRKSPTLGRLLDSYCVIRIGPASPTLFEDSRIPLACRPTVYIYRDPLHIFFVDHVDEYIVHNFSHTPLTSIPLFYRLETRPWVVMYHITLILLNAMTLAIKSERLLTLPRGIYKAAATFFTTSSFLMPHLWFEFQSMFAFKSKPSI